MTLTIRGWELLVEAQQELAAAIECRRACDAEPNPERRVLLLASAREHADAARLWLAVVRTIDASPPSNFLAGDSERKPNASPEASVSQGRVAGSPMGST